MEGANTLKTKSFKIVMVVTPFRSPGSGQARMRMPLHMPRRRAQLLGYSLFAAAAHALLPPCEPAGLNIQTQGEMGGEEGGEYARLKTIRNAHVGPGLGILGSRCC